MKLETCERLRASVPHIALVIIYSLYLLAGGILFHWLESRPVKKLVESHEKEESKVEHKIDVLFWNNSEANKTSNEGAKLDVLLDKLVNKSEHFDLGAWDPEVYESPNAWSIPSAMLFCMVTITTIGYGDLVPQTTAGRTAVILYSCIGIPLSLLFIADIGGLMASLASMITAYIRRSLCGKDKQTFQRLEEDKEVANSPKSEGYASQSRVENHHSESDALRRNPQISLEIEPSYMANVTEDDDEGAVPILVVPFILLIYMCLGAAIFCISEGWSYTDGLYFTFITLSTIGYGDLYPSKHIETNTMIPILIYVLLGLCLVSMSISLLLSKVMKRVSWMKHKIEAFGSC